MGLTLLVGLVAIALTGVGRPAPVDTIQDGEDWVLASETRHAFGLDRTAGLIAVFGDVLDERNGDALRRLEQDLEALGWVGEILTPWDLPGARGQSLGTLADRPMIRGTLIPEGGQGLLLPLLVVEGQGEEQDRARATWPGARWSEQLHATAEGALRAEGIRALDLEIGITGERPVIEAQSKAFQGERWSFMGIGALLGFLIASAAFRSVRATFLAGIPPLIGVVVSTGLARLLNLGSDGFTSIVLPLLVLTIGFTDSLHIVVATVRARKEGAETGAEASIHAIRVLAWPCALTSLTTAIGFASLATTGNALIVDFGLSCALATIVTFVCVVVAIPLLARTPLGNHLEKVEPPDFEGLQRAEDEKAGPVARLIERGVRASLRAPRTVALAGAVLTITLAALAIGLGADRRAMSDLAEGSEAAETLRRVDDELGGIFPISVRIDWQAGTDTAVALDVAREVVATLAAEPLIAGAHGPAELVDSVPAGLVGLALLPSQLRDPWLHVDERRGLVHARVPDAGSAALIPVFERVRERLDALARPGVTADLVGSHIAYLETVDEVTSDLRRSLGLAALLILVTLGVAFRSWRLGLASVVPNLLPIGASATGLYLIGGQVDVSTLTALTLSLGIATDDTIHVLARWKDEEERGTEPTLAARLSVVRTLPALTLTTLTLTAAFGQLLTSALPTIRDFGLLAGTTLVAAFFADVWLLPATLLALAKRRPKA